MSSLYVLRGKDQGQRFYLNLPLIKLGRDRENDIQLQDSEVSRRHARIVQRGGQLVFEDCGSANGSLINNQVIQSKVLLNGDHLQVGRTLLLFSSKSNTASASATAPPKVKLKAEQNGPTGSLPEGSVFADSVMAGAFDPLALDPRALDPRALPTPAPNDNFPDRHLDIMYQTALAISHTLDTDQLLNRILELILQWVQADRGCIFLLDSDTDQPIARAARVRDQQMESGPIEVSRTILDYVLEHQGGVLTSNAAVDGRWDEAESVMQMGIREAICVPMRGRYGIVGAIYVDTRSNPAADATVIRTLADLTGKKFQDQHLKLMIAIGNQAGIAIEDTSFYAGLVQSERLAAIGQTIAVMSHHIKNILQGFQGGGYLLEQGIKQQDFAVIQQGWGLLQRNQDRVYNLVMDMLSYSKDRQPLREAANVCDVVQDVIALVQTKAHNAAVTLHWRPDPAIPICWFDIESVHRAILNVVSNAIDAAKESDHSTGPDESAANADPGARPQVSIEVRYLSQPKPLIQVCVRDQGPGIDREEIEKVFSLFESSKGGRGTGLGLPVSRKIMQEHGGDIEVHSVPGQGAEFILWMPCETTAATQNSGQHTQA